MSEIEINLTLRFNIPETDFNLNSLLFGIKGANSQIMLGIAKALFMAYGRSERDRTHQRFQCLPLDYLAKAR